MKAAETLRFTPTAQPQPPNLLRSVSGSRIKEQDGRGWGGGGGGSGWGGLVSSKCIPMQQPTESVKCSTQNQNFTLLKSSTAKESPVEVQLAG